MPQPTGFQREWAKHAAATGRDPKCPHAVQPTAAACEAAAWTPVRTVKAVRGGFLTLIRRTGPGTPTPSAPLAASYAASHRWHSSGRGESREERFCGDRSHIGAANRSAGVCDRLPRRSACRITLPAGRSGPSLTRDAHYASVEHVTAITSGRARCQTPGAAAHGAAPWHEGWPQPGTGDATGLSTDSLPRQRLRQCGSPRRAPSTSIELGPTGPCSGGGGYHPIGGHARRSQGTARPTDHDNVRIGSQDLHRSGKLP